MTEQAAQRPATLARKQRYRDRQRLGQCVLRVVAPEHDLAEALLEAGRLTDDEALSRDHVERALTAVVLDFIARWVRPSR
jgi:hypothetical protein